MFKKDAWNIVGGLSKPGKMPCHGFGLPAEYCRAGSKLRTVDGTVCFRCYAFGRGNYRFPCVKLAQQRRFDIISRVLESGPNSDRWNQLVTAFSTLLENETHFRFHDSGDLQSADHLELYCDIARAVPRCACWIPTKEISILSRYSAHLIPKNLIVRYSEPLLNRVSSYRGLNSATFDTPAEAACGFICPAPQQGNACGDCRACWNPAVETVIYAKH